MNSRVLRFRGILNLISGSWLFPTKIKNNIYFIFSPFPVCTNFFGDTHVVKLSISTFGFEMANLAEEAIEVDWASAKQFIEQNIAGPIASRAAKETDTKKAIRKSKSVNTP